MREARQRLERSANQIDDPGVSRVRPSSLQMSGKYRRPGLRGVLQQPTPGRASQYRVLTKCAVPIGIDDLQRLLHDVSAKDCPLITALKHNRDVSGRMPRGRLEQQTCPSRAFTADQL